MDKYADKIAAKEIADKINRVCKAERILDSSTDSNFLVALVVVAINVLVVYLLKDEMLSDKIKALFCFLVALSSVCFIEVYKMRRRLDAAIELVRSNHKIS